jgi:hypothetical protein
MKRRMSNLLKVKKVWRTQTGAIFVSVSSSRAPLPISIHISHGVFKQSAFSSLFFSVSTGLSTNHYHEIALILFSFPLSFIFNFPLSLLHDKILNEHKSETSKANLRFINENLYSVCVCMCA